MRVVSIYSNKGGEGKSTVTVGLTEFLSGNRDKRVLLIDLDAQASSSSAILGHKAVVQAIGERRTSVDLINQLRAKKQVPTNLADFLEPRNSLAIATAAQRGSVLFIGLSRSPVIRTGCVSSYRFA